MIYQYLKYKYHQRHNYLDAYIQDLIANKTSFIPYKIKLINASKENQKSKDFDLFTFMYEDTCYYLDSNNKLHIKTELSL